MEILAHDRGERANEDLERWLADHREPLVRKWLALLVDRLTLGELAERPLGARIEEFDLMLEAARATASAMSDDASDEDKLGPEISRVAATGPFAIALLDLPAGDRLPPPAAWRRTLRAGLDPGATVISLDEQTVALVLAADGAGEARTVADRVRAGAWEALGGRAALPDCAIAAHPQDGTTPGQLIATARARLSASATRASAPAPGARLEAAPDERDRPDRDDTDELPGRRAPDEPAGRRVRNESGLPPLPELHSASRRARDTAAEAAASGPVRDETLRQALERWAEVERQRADEDADDGDDDDGGSGVRPPAPVTPLRPL